MKQTAQRLALIGLGVLLAEILARVLLAVALPGYEKTRQFLRGEIDPSPTYLSCISQPYLLYVPSPNFSNEGGPQHNAQGYRGTAVPLRRTPGVARILCLGGSTTYGEGAARADETYPAYLEHLLSQSPPKGFKRVEVINAGIPFGTTAESLTHYHFKFHYYRPDLVILNPGGNDAMALIVPYYHPDYSHWRKTLQAPQRLPPVGRAALRSRLISLFVIPLLYGARPASDSFVKLDLLPPVAPWYQMATVQKQGRALPYVPPEEIAFLHNLETTLDEIQKDGAKVLLVPFRPALHHRYEAPLVKGFELEWKILKDLSKNRGVTLAPFPVETISPENWLDDCHTNARGYAQKAAYLVPFARRLLERK